MEKLNILWLILDCGRYDHFSAYGYPRPTTPYLDQLIDEGLSYNNAFSPAVWSLPAYTSLLTGLYPSEHNVNTFGRTLNRNVLTLPEQLQKAGYHTACFSNNAWLSPTFGSGRGFDRFDTMWFKAQKRLQDKAEFLLDRTWGVLTGWGDKGARRTNRRVINWLQEHQDSPTFSFVAYMEPHMPYSNHHALKSEFLTRPAKQVNRDAIHSLLWMESLPHSHKFSDELLESIQYLYDLELRYIDQQIKDLLNQLSKEKLLDKSIVIISADHGDLLGENGMLGHQFSIAEPLRHVPLVIWSPTLWKDGRQIDDLVQTIDIASTICEWVGITWPATPSTHLLPESNGSGTRRYAITEYTEPYLKLVRKRYPNTDITTLDVSLACASTRKHKVVLSSPGGWQGYNLANDPDEINPLPLEADPEFGVLQTALESHLNNSKKIESSDEEVPDEVIEQLRALGYLE